MDQRSGSNLMGQLYLPDIMDRSLRNIPREMRDEFGYTYENSLCALFGDPWINPNSGGLLTIQNIAGALCISVRQLERLIRTDLSGVFRYACGVYATNVSTVAAVRQMINASNYAKRIRALNSPRRANRDGLHEPDLEGSQDSLAAWPDDPSSGGMVTNVFTVVSSGSTITEPR